MTTIFLDEQHKLYFEYRFKLMGSKAGSAESEDCLENLTAIFENVVMHSKHLEQECKELDDELEETFETISDLEGQIAYENQYADEKLEGTRALAMRLVEDLERGDDYSRSLYDLKDALTYKED